MLAASARSPSRLRFVASDALQGHKAVGAHEKSGRGVSGGKRGRRCDHPLCGFDVLTLRNTLHVGDK